MTPEQAHRLLEVEYLVMEYEIAKASDGHIPPVAHANIRRWRKERDALRRIAEATFGRS